MVYFICFKGSSNPEMVYTKVTYGSANKSLRTVTTYDDSGKVIRVQQQKGNLGARDAATNKRYYSYQTFKDTDYITKTETSYVVSGGRRPIKQWTRDLESGVISKGQYRHSKGSGVQKVGKETPPGGNITGTKARKYYYQGKPVSEDDYRKGVVAAAEAKRQKARLEQQGISSIDGKPIVTKDTPSGAIIDETTRAGEKSGGLVTKYGSMGIQLRQAPPQQQPQSLFEQMYSTQAQSQPQRQSTIYTVEQRPAQTIWLEPGQVSPDAKAKYKLAKENKLNTPIEQSIFFKPAREASSSATKSFVGEDYLIKKPLKASSATVATNIDIGTAEHLEPKGRVTSALRRKAMREEARLETYIGEPARPYTKPVADIAVKSIKSQKRKLEINVELTKKELAEVQKQEPSVKRFLKEQMLKNKIRQLSYATAVPTHAADVVHLFGEEPGKTAVASGIGFVSAPLFGSIATVSPAAGAVTGYAIGGAYGISKGVEWVEGKPFREVAAETSHELISFGLGHKAYQYGPEVVPLPRYEVVTAPGKGGVPEPKLEGITFGTTSRGGYIVSKKPGGSWKFGSQAIELKGSTPPQEYWQTPAKGNVLLKSLKAQSTPAQYEKAKLQWQTMKSGQSEPILMRIKDLFTVRELPKEVKSLTPGQTEIVHTYARRLGGTEYGSGIMKSRLDPDIWARFRGDTLPADVDLQYKYGGDATRIIAREMVADLKTVEGGYKVRQSKARQELIESKDPVTGRWRHAVDIHSIEDISPDARLGGERAFGLELTRPTTKIEGVEAQTTPEQLLRKGASITTPRVVNTELKLAMEKVGFKGIKTGEVVVAPEPHRMKDIGDFFAEAQQIGRYKILGRKTFSKRLARLESLYPEAIRSKGTTEFKIFEFGKSTPTSVSLPISPNITSRILTSPGLGISVPKPPSKPYSTSVSKVSSPSISVSLPSSPSMPSPSEPSPPESSPSIPSPSIPSSYYSSRYSPSYSVSISGGSPSYSISRPATYKFGGSIFAPTILPPIGGGGGGGRGSGQTRMKRRTYAPSLSAIVQQVSGPKLGVVSSLEVYRPIGKPIELDFLSRKKTKRRKKKKK